MYDNCHFLDHKVAVSLRVDEWAEVVAAVGTSALTPRSKEHINATIFDQVTQS